MYDTRYIILTASATRGKARAAELRAMSESWNRDTDLHMAWENLRRLVGLLHTVASHL